MTTQTRAIVTRNRLGMWRRSRSRSLQSEPVPLAGRGPLSSWRGDRAAPLWARSKAVMGQKFPAARMHLGHLAAALGWRSTACAPVPLSG